MMTYPALSQHALLRVNLSLLPKNPSFLSASCKTSFSLVLFVCVCDIYICLLFILFYLTILYYLWWLGTGSLAAKTDPELLNLLPPPSWYWGYWCVAPNPADAVLRRSTCQASPLLTTVRVQCSGVGSLLQ